MRFSILVAISLGLVACSSSSGSSTPPPPGDGGGGGGAQITISNYTFSPADLTVDAGTVIHIVNNDGFSHTITSETADNVFAAGAVNGVSFDTGSIPAASTSSGGPYGGGSTTTPGTIDLTIPATAPSGTVIPFFCNIHKGSMNTPNGHITIH